MADRANAELSWFPFCFTLLLIWWPRLVAVWPCAWMRAGNATLCSTSVSGAWKRWFNMFGALHRSPRTFTCWRRSVLLAQENSAGALFGGSGMMPWCHVYFVVKKKTFQRFSPSSCNPPSSWAGKGLYRPSPSLPAYVVVGSSRRIPKKEVVHGYGSYVSWHRNLSFVMLCFIQGDSAGGSGSVTFMLGCTGQDICSLRVEDDETILALKQQWGAWAIGEVGGIFASYVITWRLFAGAYLLWLMDGGRFLRVHNGQCFLYHDSGGIPSLLWKPAGANCSSSEGIHHAGRGAIPNFAWRSRRNGWWHSK